MLQLRTFGGLSIEGDEPASARTVSHPGRLILLGVLAACGSGGLSRARLYSLLWPESTLGRAQGCLKQSLFALRKDLHEENLTLGKHQLCLNPERITADVSVFTRAIEAGNLALAVSVYRGVFLEGVRPRSSGEFDRWAERERRRLCRSYTDSLERLAVAAAKRGEQSTAVDWWIRLSDEEPFSARIAARCMDALEAAGRREAAIDHAVRYQALMRDELGAEPDTTISERLASLCRSRGIPMTRAARTHKR